MISVGKPLKSAAGKAHDFFDSTRGLRSYRGPGVVDHPTPLRGRLGAQPPDRLFRLLLTAGAECVEQLGGGRILTKTELQSIGDAAVALDDSGRHFLGVTEDREDVDDFVRDHLRHLGYE
jgi:hypothetical protein